MKVFKIGLMLSISLSSLNLFAGDVKIVGPVAVELYNEFAKKQPKDFEGVEDAKLSFVRTLGHYKQGLTVMCVADKKLEATEAECIATVYNKAGIP